jgi:hypothetical protein
MVLWQCYVCDCTMSNGVFVHIPVVGTWDALGAIRMMWSQSEQGNLSIDEVLVFVFC